MLVIGKIDGLVIDISSGYEGRFHDLKVFEGSGLVEGLRGFKVRAWVDKEYTATEGVANGWEIKRPKKVKGVERKGDGREQGDKQ
ncbi:MAG: transposase family protein [Armatimonadota bacterium]|nr:transposase family protein [Armatimonadota bacterium]MCX7778023.1 transposase family protein [Armatimonadota bacterium]MDW8024979.1 transposase family protein [Armatimonadota bacterium]